MSNAVFQRSPIIIVVGKVSIAQMNTFCLAGFYSGKKVTDMGFPPFYFSFDYAVMRTNVMWASQRLRGKENK